MVVVSDLRGGDPDGGTAYAWPTLAGFLLGFAVGWFVGRITASQRRMSGVLDSMLDAVVIGSAVRDGSGRLVDARVTYGNAGAATVLRVGSDGLIGRPWSDLWPGIVPADLNTALLRALDRHEVLELTDYVVPGANGAHPRVLDLRATPLQDDLVVTWRDVSARHRDARAVELANAQFAAAFEHTPVGMLLVDPTHRILRTNEAFAAIVGRPLVELTGTSMDPLVDPRDVDEWRTAFEHLTSGVAQASRYECRLLTVDGSSRWVSVTAAPIQDASGAYVVEHVEDIDDRKGFEARLQFLADHDPLTGLYNRRRFAEELAHHLGVDGRYGGSSAVVLLDLDNFKYINDTLGHQVGDRFIRAIATQLRQRLRDSDVIGRLGGDEFAILLPGADEAQAVAMTAAVLDGIRYTVVQHSGQRVRSTGSAGVAVVKAGGVHPDEVLANSDLAMYAAKEAGRDTYTVYDPTGPHSEQARSKFRWLERIRLALDHDLFTLLAQPILDLGKGEVTGCELLLRMRDGDRLIGPDIFLPIAERHGLANLVDRFVIGHAIALIAQQQRPAGFRWEINLSAESLGDPGIPELIERHLAQTGVSPDALVFEITETAAITNFDNAQAFAARLTSIGCRFALDDFGAGYGSFYYLKHLPFEYLKIDGEFIRQLTSSDTDSVIVEAIVGAAKKLGKQTIAEYVGDAVTLDRVRQLDVDHAQGYYIGRPVDPGAAAVVPVPREPHATP